MVSRKTKQTPYDWLEALRKRKRDEDASKREKSDH